MSDEVGGKRPEMVIKRTFRASREQVWKAWTDPDVFKIWWGPRKFTTPVSKIDLHVGGKYLYSMRSPDGKDFWSTGTYKEIAYPTRLVYTDAFSDHAGRVIPASKYGMPGTWPLEMLVTVRFEEKDGTTEMELVHSGVPNGVASDMTMAGWSESFDKLDEYLETGKVSMPKTVLIAYPGTQEIVIRRIFDAPRDLVFKAFTDPELIPQWWGPAKYRTAIDRLEARAGGSWRYVQRDDEGNLFAFRGVFHEVRSPELIIQTFEFEPMAGHVDLQTATFEETDGGTLYSGKSVYLSTGDRDAELAAGMEAGMNEGFERLDTLLERMKRG
jgi:uncharacterized protein YndB with AHSA1/START domain